MAEKVKAILKQLADIDAKLAQLEIERTTPKSIEEIEKLEKEETELLQKQHRKRMELLNLKQELRRKEFTNVKGEPKPESFLLSSSIRLAVNHVNPKALDTQVLDKELMNLVDEKNQPKKKTVDEQEAEVQKWEIAEEEIIIDKNRVLGKGSFGAVYAGTCRGKDVAVKILDNDVSDNVLEDFKNEVAVMAKLRHENLLLFMGVSTQGGKLQIVTELMPKGSVHFLLRDKVPLTMKRKMLIAIDTALGIFWLHQTGILHLDLKPANLLVNDSWVVKVADFGISQMRENLDSIGGTLNYMSPEILMGGEVDEKADVYSFGMVLWELVSERVPWRNELNSLDEYKITVGVSGKRPPVPQNCPPKLLSLIEKCWAQNPKDRLTFAEIAESNIFHEIIIEDVMKDSEGRKLWGQKFMGKYNIPWKKFQEGFCDYLGIPQPKTSEANNRYTCLKLTVAYNEAEEVTIENFANFLVWFGPLHLGFTILDSLFNLVSTKGFWGELSAEDAEKALTSGKQQSYLIRFSANPGDFVVSTKTKKDAYVHYKILHKPSGPYTFGERQFSSIHSILQEFKKKLGLKYPSLGSKYQTLLSHANINQDHLVGYVDPAVARKGARHILKHAPKKGSPKGAKK